MESTEYITTQIYLSVYPVTKLLLESYLPIIKIKEHDINVREQHNNTHSYIFWNGMLLFSFSSFSLCIFFFIFFYHFSFILFHIRNYSRYFYLYIFSLKFFSFVTPHVPFQIAEIVRCSQLPQIRYQDLRNVGCVAFIALFHITVKIAVKQLNF